MLVALEDVAPRILDEIGEFGLYRLLIFRCGALHLVVSSEKMQNSG